VTIAAGDAEVAVTSAGGAGAASLDGLPPATTLDVTLATASAPRRPVETITTVSPPPGRLLTRFATVNDMHVGERGFGLVHKLRDPGGPGDPYPLRCAKAAFAEAQAWGAEAMVAKGDLTWHGASAEWEALASLLAGVAVPVHALLGNHDLGRVAVDGAAILARRGITIPTKPWSVDLEGIRVVLAQTAAAKQKGGRVDAIQRQAVSELAGAADGPVFLALHHYPQHFAVPTAYPPGIPGPMARQLFAAVAKANPATFVSTGHSHRHRRHRHGTVVVTEIGATMHYPGTWAGYAVHEGGIRQVVRRVAAPAAIAWTERTRRVLGGVWGLYSPGPRSSRCFTHLWPERG
jgi:predicted phosphodiesterase